MTLETFKNILQEKKFWVFVAIIIVMAVGIIFIIQLPRRPLGTGIEPERRPTTLSVKVVRVEPLPDQKDITTSPTIKISFEKSIEGKKIAINSTPAASFDQQLSSKGFHLTLTPKSTLKSSTKYTLSVLEGKAKIYSWSFTTGTKGADPALLEKIKEKLPYQGKHFRIAYSSVDDEFVVTIDAKPLDTYKKAALSWFASQGLANAESKINIFYLTIGEAAQ